MHGFVFDNDDRLWNLSKAPIEVNFQLPSSDDEYESEEDTKQLASGLKPTSLKPEGSVKESEPAAPTPDLSSQGSSIFVGWAYGAYTYLSFDRLSN